MYHKYYCGYTKTHTHDTTIKQMLCALGYSDKSNANVSKLCSYNCLLVDCGLLNITKQRDENGNERNIYRINNRL